MTFRRLALAALVGLLAVATVRAAPPAVTYLYPAGGQRGQTVEVTAGGTFERWPVQVWVDRQDVIVKPGKDRGKLSVAIPADAEPGLCWLRFFDEQGASSLRPFQIGTLPSVLEQEPNNEARKPQVLDSTSLVIDGRLGQANDVDCFAVKLTKGQTLVASMTANEVFGSPIDAILQIVSADGFVLDENNDTHDLDPQVVFVAPSDGSYVVRTFAFPATPDSSIRFTGSDASVFRLTLTTAGFVDHAFPLAVSRADPVPVEPQGWNIPDTLKKLTPDRERPDVADLWHALLANTATVRLEPHPAVVRAAENDRQQPQPLDLPMTVSGRLRPRASDWFQMQVKKGQKLFFQVESRSLGQPADVVLRLYDAAGKTVAQADDPPRNREGIRDPELSFTAPDDGRYVLELRDLHGRGGFRFVYRLRALAAVPDYEVTLAADQFVLTPGKPLEIPVTVVRRHGFDREVEVTAVDLPDGVTATPVVAKAGGSAPVMLKLTATKGPASGVFQVRAKAKGDPDLARVGAAAVAGLQATTPHPWLTVLKPTSEPPKN